MEHHPIVQRWIDRHQRMHAKLVDSFTNDDGETVYKILFHSRYKTKLGFVRDGMRTRYGVAVVASLDPQKGARSIWTSGDEIIESDFDLLCRFGYDGEGLGLPDFDFNSIKDIQE